MRSRPLNLAAVAALMAGLGAPMVAAEAPSTSESSVVQQQNKDSTAPTQQVTPPSMAQFILPRSFGRFFRAQHPIWIGRKKRGNRRNRSRFTYFR